MATKFEVLKHRDGPPLTLGKVGKVEVLDGWGELFGWVPDPQSEAVIVWGTDSDFSRVAQWIHRRKLDVSLIPMPLGPTASIARSVYGDRDPAGIVEALHMSSTTEMLASMKLSDTLRSGPELAFSLGLGWPARASTMLDAMETKAGLEELAVRLSKQVARPDALGATVTLDGQKIVREVEALQVSSLSRIWPGVKFDRSGSQLGVVAVDSLANWLKKSTTLGRFLSRSGEDQSCSTIHIDADARYVVDAQARESGDRVLRIERGPDFTVLVPA